MKPEIKQRWVKALRSGDYSQAKGKLRNNQGYCCLGVLCDLYAKEHDVEWDQFGPIYTMLERESILPNEILKWSDIRENNPCVVVNGNEKSLARMNDTGYTFEEIAQIIEEQL